jgi:spore germination cell wall hydrolase CwlJ-like protein
MQKPLLIIPLLGMLLPTLGMAAPDCEDYLDDDRIALACNIYFEARDQSIEGMMAVVAVTMNRVESAKFPDTVAKVVWDNRQFSWTKDGKVDRPRNRPSWLQALAIAGRFTITKEYVQSICPTATQINAALLGRPDPGCASYRNLVNIHIYLAQQLDPTGGALYYYAEYIPPPYWVFGEPSARIGKHIFYVEARIR